MNKVKEIITKIVDKTLSKEYIASITNFDVMGNEILSKEYDQDNNLLSMVKTAYNLSNQKAEVQIFSSPDYADEIHTYNYDSNQRLESIVVKYADESISVKSYKKDGNTLVIQTLDEDNNQEEKEVIVLDENNHVLSRKVYDYDNNQTMHISNEFIDNRLVKTYNYDEKNREINHKVIGYNPQGQITKEYTLTEKGDLIYKVEYVYDEKNRVKTVLTSRGSTIYEYDDEQLTETQTIMVGNQLSGRVVIYRNQEGLVIKEDSLTQEKIFEYKY